MTNLLVAAAVTVATNLPAVVVEASRLDRAPLEIPAAVHVIGSDEIASSGARTAVDLLSKAAPEIHFRNLGAGNPIPPSPNWRCAAMARTDMAGRSSLSTANDSTLPT